MRSDFRFGSNVAILFGILALIFIGTVIITRIDAAAGKGFEEDDFAEFDDDFDEDPGLRKKQKEPGKYVRSKNKLKSTNE